MYRRSKNDNKLVQNRGVQIHPNTTHKSKSESPREGSKLRSRKVDFNIVRDPNNILGLKNCEMFVSSTRLYRSCTPYQYVDNILISYGHL